MAHNVFGSPRDYLRAIESLLHLGIAEHQWRILQLHRRAKASTTTFVNLADAMGYNTFGGINAQYGRLARAVAEKMKIRQRPSVGFWLYVLLDWAEGNPTDPLTRFKLRPEVVAALNQIEARGKSRIIVRLREPARNR